MSPIPSLRSCLYATFAASLTACVTIPIPATQDSVVSGFAVADDEVRSMVSGDEDSHDVKARLGEPTLDFGPQRIFVYFWTVNKGAIVWFLGGSLSGTGGVEPLVDSHLFIIAFDPDGKVLKTGTMEFNPFDTIAEHVHGWLSSVELAAQVVGPRPGQSTGRPVLFVYRPSASPCSFPTFDANIFKPSVTVNGIVVGDLAKGEYLAAEIEAGTQAITIDPVPYYRFSGQEGSYFVQDVSEHGIPTMVHVSGDPNHPVYIETYLCTGMGETEMHATVRDAVTAMQAIRTLQPAW